MLRVCSSAVHMAASGLHRARCVDLNNIDLSPDNPEHKEMFDRFLQKQSSLNALMQTYFETAFGPRGHAEKTEDMLIAQDIWDSIRTCRGINRMDGCIHTSSEPLPDIRVEEP